MNRMQQHSTLLHDHKRAAQRSIRIHTEWAATEPEGVLAGLAEGGVG
jgi:hypothetical protein